jgi:hypothetical protein
VVAINEITSASVALATTMGTTALTVNTTMPPTILTTMRPSPSIYRRVVAREQ